jgi:hypothetical protein
MEPSAMEVMGANWVMEVKNLFLTSIIERASIKETSLAGLAGAPR